MSKAINKLTKILFCVISYAFFAILMSVASSNSGDAILASAIISMAHNLNLVVVGEGVETKTQLAFLRANGCNIIQGFYFSKALPPDEFVNFFNEYNQEDHQI